MSNRAIGIDIGGTKTAVAAVDGAGNIHGRASFATRSGRGFGAGLAELLETVGQVLREARWTAEELDGLGVGCAGPVSPADGTIHNPYTLPGWEGADILSPLRRAFGAPVCLENDADAAAVGEFTFGAGRGASPLVMITLGTGIGGSILLNGRIYRGATGEHPELGHLAVVPGGPACYCGLGGCWESLASGTAIAEAGKALGFANSRELFAAAESRGEASAIVQRAVDATTGAVWSLLHTLLPERIILGGGIGEEHFERFAGPVRGRLLAATQIPKHSIDIVKAGLGNDAGVIGAACLARQTSTLEIS